MLETFVGFTFSPKNSKLVIGASSPTSPLRISANPFDASKQPQGIVMLDGKMHTTLKHDNLPFLIVVQDGSAHIRKSVALTSFSNARYAFSGSALLIKDGEAVPIESDIKSIEKGLDIKRSRIGIGILKSGEILAVPRVCSAIELQDLMMALDVRDAMLGSSDDIFVDYPIGGFKMGNAPVSIIEAMNVTPLTGPVCVIDAGHGGSDPGAVGNGVREKDVVLDVSINVANHLSKNYVGTFVLMRDSDTTVGLEARSTKANKLNADFFLSIHANAVTNKLAQGFETFVQPTTSAGNIAMRKVLHTEIMNYLAPLGVLDRGMKTQNLSVLRLTKCPAILVELLFVSNPREAAMLADRAFRAAYSKVIAEAYAKALGLTKKVTHTVPQGPQKLYRVQVGAYSSRESAEQLQEVLQKLGYSAIVKFE